MPAFVDILLGHLAAFDASEEDRLHAIGQLRAETWIAALSVIVDVEGQTQAEQSLEALTQADSFLVLLALGWTPNSAGPRPIVTGTRVAKALHRQLGRALGRWLQRRPSDPGSVVRAVEAAYRQTLTRILRGAGPRLRRDALAIHYAFRHTVIASTLELIASSPDARPEQHHCIGELPLLSEGEVPWKLAHSTLGPSPRPDADAKRSPDR